MTVIRMDNVSIVVEDLDAAVAFFAELGLTLEGRMPIDGDWADRVTGVRDQRVEIAMMRTRTGRAASNSRASMPGHRFGPSPGAGELAGVSARHVRGR